MPLPKLTDVGDTFTGIVQTCVPVTKDDERAVVQFVFGPDEILELPRIGVDMALLNLGYKYDDGVVAYDQVSGDALTFSRIPPSRGKTPRWSITKPKGVEPVVPPLAPIPPVEPKPDPAPPVGDDKRAAIHAAYVRELGFVVSDVLPVVKKAKALAAFDVNAAVATLMIQMDRRGCL